MESDGENTAMHPATECNLHRQEEIRRKNGKCIHRGGEDNVFYTHEVKKVGEKINQKERKMPDEAKKCISRDVESNPSHQENFQKD